MTQQHVTGRWDGEAIVPLNPKEADERFVLGGLYDVHERGQASVESRNHYFATVDAAFDNLPEHLTEWFPNATALRKWALVKAGHCDTTVIARIGTVTAIPRVALADYSIIVQDGDTLVAHTAHSQSKEAMGNERFQQSKEDVLRVLSGMIGVDVTELKRAA